MNWQPNHQTFSLQFWETQLPERLAMKKDDTAQFEKSSCRNLVFQNNVSQFCLLIPAIDKTHGSPDLLGYFFVLILNTFSSNLFSRSCTPFYQKGWMPGSESWVNISAEKTGSSEFLSG